MVNLLWKEDKIILTNNGKTMTEEAMPLSNQMSGQMVNHPSAKQLVFVKQKKFGKKIFIGLAIALLLVLTTSLGVFLFSSKGTNLGGLWVNSNNTGLVYDLNGKKSKLVVRLQGRRNQRNLYWTESQTEV